MTFQPGHYEAVEDSRYFQVGDRVRFVRLDEDGVVTLVRYDSSYTTTEEEFRQQFVFLPDGEARYLAELTTTTVELTTLTAELADLSGQLDRVKLGLDAGGNLGGMQALLDASPEQPAAGSGSALVTTTSRLQQVRSAALSVNVRVQNTRELVDAKRKHIERLTGEALAVTRALLKPIQEHVKKLEEVVWTLELYAGSREEIHHLLTGKPAPDTEPLVIRQGVLSMAEEAAVMLDDQGMDSQNIDLFDAWLRENPDRIDLFLPERKGVVAFVARWDAKDYGNAFHTSAVAKDNTYTHFLVRNGENVYRISADFQSGRTLVPTHAEFMELFLTDEWVNGKRVKVPLRPGSREFLEAEKKSGDKKRHYYRVALILQGLVDRTAVFQPLPEDQDGVRRVVLTTEADYAAGRVRVLEDVSMALEDPRETFSEFRLRVNASMEVGRRVIGDFSRRSSGSYGDHDDRVTPRRAERPEMGRPLTLEGRNGPYFVARYDRNEEIWRRDRWGWDSGQPKTRASIKILPTDDSILLLDHPDVTEEALTDFLTRRSERAAYLSMIPLLKVAIHTLRAEREAQAPFIDLLARYAQEHLGEPGETARDLAASAVDAYRTRYRLHRTLPVEDKEAFQGCVDALGALREQQADRQARRDRGEYARVLAALQAAHPQAMLIAHRGGTEYVAVTPHRDRENVYASVSTYRAPKSGAPVLKHTEDWRTLDHALRRAEALHVTDRFHRWSFRASTKFIPTGPELDALKEQVLPRVVELLGHEPLAVALATHKGYAFAVWVPDRENRDPNSLRMHYFKPVRDGSGTFVFPQQRTTTAYTAEFEPRRAWHLSETQRKHAPERPWLAAGFEVVMVNAPACAALEARVEEARRASAARAERHRLLSELRRPLRDQVEAAWWEEQRQTFLREYGAQSAHLWADHKKSVKADSLRYPGLGEREDLPVNVTLSALLDAGLSVAGLSVAEAVALARAHGAEVGDVTPELAALRWPL